MSLMKFSIIIPVFKVERYLSQCVNSIRGQSYSNFEVILVDDGSPDSSPEICDEFARKDVRIRAIHKKNGGLSDARNVGLEAATGDYVIFLDSDDWWCDMDALSIFANRLLKTNADVLIFQSKKYYQLTGSFSKRQTPIFDLPTEGLVSIRTLMQQSLFVACAWDKVIRRQALINGKIEFVVGQLSEDIEWCCKLLAQSLSYTVIKNVIHIYRQQNTTSITSNITEKNLTDIQMVISRLSKQASRMNCEPILHFLALEFILLCSISDKVSKVGGRKIINGMSSFFYLLNYDWYPRVAVVSRIRFLGFRVVRRLLVLARKVKGLVRI